MNDEQLKELVTAMMLEIKLLEIDDKLYSKRIDNIIELISKHAIDQFKKSITEY